MEANIFFINERYMVQLPSTQKSGLYKFRDVDDNSIYLLEKHEIPKHYLTLLNSEQTVQESDTKKAD